MRPLLISAAVLFVAACAPDPVPQPPPVGRFYFPTGLAYSQGDDDAGVLFVASSNFDKRFDRGALTLVPLGPLGLPELGAISDGGVTSDGGRPLAITDLFPGNADGTAQTVEIQSFAGELALWQTLTGPRIFVASRAERSPLQYIEAVGSTLSCSYAQEEAPRDCFSTAPSLVEAEETASGLPRAPAPSGIFVTDDGGVFISHLQGADSPVGSNDNAEAYIVTTNANSPSIVASTEGDDASFISIGAGGASSIAVTPRFVVASGRFVRESNGGALIKLVDRTDRGNVINVGLESSFHSTEARGLALYDVPTAPESRKRIFLAARDPDVLLVASMDGADTRTPSVRLIRVVALPDNPNDVKLIDRPGRLPLAVISCSGDDSVVIYDDEVGAVVARLTGVGDQPYAIAIQRAGKAARIFVTNFADGRVAVIDLDDTDRPYSPRMVAHLGESQQCIVNGTCAVGVLP